MILLEDTRNPISKHQNIHDYCDANGIRIERTKLYVGDYTLPTNQAVCVDTKAGLQEVYDNVLLDKKRFCSGEAVRAKTAGIKLVVLVEEVGISDLYDVLNWDNPRMAHWKKVYQSHLNGKMHGVKIPSAPPYSNARLAQKMSEVSRQYGIEWQFCGKADTGARIIEILGGGA